MRFGKIYALYMLYKKAKTFVVKVIGSFWFWCAIICLLLLFAIFGLDNLKIRTMQDREFEKLFNEKGGVKYFTEMQNPGQFKSLSELMRNKNTEEVNQIIEKNAIEMPQELTYEIRHFIDLQRKKKVKERTIRRMVKRKFGIMIVPQSN